jgi:hypothetical protein
MPRRLIVERSCAALDNLDQVGALARNPDGGTQIDMFRRGFSSAVLGHLVLTGPAESGPPVPPPTPERRHRR